MDIFGYIPGKSLGLGEIAVALGFFDGVHLAHRELIAMTVAEARSRGIKSAVFTFSSEGGGLKSSVPRIYSTDEKLDIISTLGVDVAVVADFGSVCSMSADEFISDVLIGDLNATAVFAGYNFRFGKGASGDANVLTRGMAAGGREAKILDEYDFSGSPLSSTQIRAALDRGELERANAMLGAPYRLRAKVVHGRGEGRKMGIPTVNADIPDTRVMPKRGVYRTAVAIDGRLFSAITNVGTCPTFGERRLHAETYIINFEGDLYGQKINVYFLGFLRDERVFGGAGELTEQIERDKARAIEENERDFGKLKWTEFGLS